MITLLQNKNSFYNYQKPLNFRASDSYMRSADSVDLGCRKVLNTASDIFEKREKKEKTLELLNENLSAADRYIKAGRLYGSNIDVEINTENGILDKLTDDDSSKIFIMNHDNQSADPKLLLIFNFLLMEMYKAKGKGDKCPEARIIMNENIIKSASPDKQKVFKKLGAVGVDLSNTKKNSLDNAKKMLSIMSEFAKNEANIFIFPEGKMSVFKTKTMEEKFQNGVANMAVKELLMKDEVQVVPLGFSYPKKGNVGIYIGNPVKIKTANGTIMTSSGNITDSEFANEVYKNYFNNFNDSEFSPILEKGKPVSSKDVIPYIAGILCENLKICKAESYKMVEKNKDDKNVTLI